MLDPQAKFLRRFEGRYWRALAGALLLLGLAGSYHFFWNSLTSYTLLRSAYDVGLPSASSVREWMTLDYVSDHYDVPYNTLLDGLGLPSTYDRDKPLFEIAKERHDPPIDLDRIVQLVIAEGTVAAKDQATVGTEDDDLDHTSLAALLRYSYPALGLILFLGALGVPVPTSVATVVAGVLASDGSMSWMLATATVVIASVVGDVVLYWLGQRASETFLSRYGRYFGYAGKFRNRIEALFARWGGVTVLLTRTLVSSMSSVASVFAGLSRFSFSLFVAYCIVGRILWTGAYFGAGYYLGHDIDASRLFLRDVSMLLVSLALTGISAFYFYEWWRERPAVAAE